MKCPRCGNEMVLDEHRKIDLYMCYECGYIEGRNLDDETQVYHETNLEHLHSLNLSESVASIAKDLDVAENDIHSVLERHFSKSSH